MASDLTVVEIFALLAVIIGLICQLNNICHRHLTV